MECRAIKQMDPDVVAMVLFVGDFVKGPKAVMDYATAHCISDFWKSVLLIWIVMMIVINRHDDCCGYSVIKTS